MGFGEYDDQNTKGENINLVDPSDPNEKATITNGEINVNDSIGNVSSPILTAVGTTAVRIDNPQLAGRKEVDIQTNKDVYIGYSNAVTTANYAYFLRKGQITAFILNENVELWAISTTASAGSDDVVLNQGAGS